MTALRSIPVAFVMFLTVQTVCKNNAVEFGGDSGMTGYKCNLEVKSFYDRHALAEYLKSQYSPMVSCVGAPCIQVYEAKPIEYQVNVQTKERKREITETVESGREIIFK